MRVDLAHAHGSPILRLYNGGCRCVACRASAASYNAAYRESHKEEAAAYKDARRDHIIAADRARRAENREAIAAYNRTYNATHREEISARKTAYYDPERRAAYYAANREAIAIKTAAYEAAHREESTAKTRRYRARKMGASGSHDAADIRAQFERQKGRCYWCGQKVAWKKKHADHVVPLSSGGSNGPENLVISCAFCNDSKGAKHPMDFAGRML
jgi:5-methylcytosine-specific restriction endonuclease McrA